MSTTVVVSNHPALGAEVTKPPPSPPTTTIPPPVPIAQHGLLMKAVTAGKSVVTVAGVELKNVIAHNAPSDDTTDPGEFVVQGTIDLFGNKDITAELDVWHGAPPTGVTIGSAAPSVQRAVIKGDVKLSQLIPSLSGTSLGADLGLKNVSIYHQNYPYDPTKDLGYDLNADLVIDSSLGSLSSILSKVLGVDELTIRIRANLGPDQSWNAAPNVNALTIEGSFVGHTFTATPGVQITSVGIRVILSHSPDKGVTPDVEVFGTLNLTLPGGGLLPMELEYTVRDVDGTAEFAASLPSGVTWVNPMGVQGFVLNPVTFSSRLPLSDPWKGLTLDIAAQFQYLSTIINFSGSYVPGGACSIHANIQGFDLASLQQLYEAVHHEALKTPNVDVTIESADLLLKSGDGFTATLTNVNIAGHGSGNADLSFSSSGSVIHAELGTIQFGDVTVNSAYIQLDLQPASSSRSSDATIHGDIQFESLETDVVVHLYRSPPSVVPKRTEWTVYAELTASDNTLALSRIDPRLKGTEFDLALRNAVFIAASQDDPDAGTFITSAYEPKEGIQVFATFDEIPVFNSLAKSNVTGMVLTASWSRAAGFSLKVFLPVARKLTLGKGITTTPVTLSLDMIPSPIDNAKLVPSLQISAGLDIPVAHCPEPLLFQMTLAATDTNATIAAELKGDWIDPFGISDQVVIGPDLLLQANFDYVTGLEGVLFQGGFAIGQFTGTVVVSVDEDPLKEMVYTEFHNLNLTDVVAFTEKLLHLKLPPPPSNFLEFEEVKVYMCPAGLSVQGVVYPPGFSFESDMVLFGKRISVSCDTNDTLLSINGSVEDFDLGPLKVTGLDGAKEAALQVKIGKDVQHLLVDGAVTLYAETVGLHLLVDTQPSPQISFQTEFKLTELLTFNVKATLIGEPDLKDLSKADFTFDADLEQHLVDYVHDELLKLFTKAQQAAEDGIEVAKKRVAEEQATLDNDIADAKARLNAARDKWEANQKSVTEKNSQTINEYNAKIQSLQNDVASAEKAYNAAFQRAQADLTNAQHDLQVKAQAGENDLENAKRKAASDVDAAKGNVAAAEAAMNRDFGSAENDIENAKRKVGDLQGQINSTRNEMSQYEHGSWLNKLKVPALAVKLAGLEVAMKTAQGALDVAEAVLKASNYVAAKAGLDAAQKCLDLAARAGPALISDAEKALNALTEVAQAAVNRASDALRAVENGSEKIVFDGAVAALAAYKRVNDVLFEAANKAIADLVKGVEYLAYQAATTALAVAQGATKSLDAAEAVLSETEKGVVEVLDIGKEIVDAGAEALDITTIHVSGSLGKSVGGAALNADIKGVFLGKPFEFAVDLNPSKVENFLKDLLQKLKDDVKKDLHL